MASKKCRGCSEDFFECLDVTGNEKTVINAVQNQGLKVTEETGRCS